jgi:hypothetical protein
VAYLTGITPDRHVIESTTIALSSNATGTAIDPPSRGWLGKCADRQAIRDSGIWNVNFAYDTYARSGLSVLEAHISRFGTPEKWTLGLQASTRPL